MVAISQTEIQDLHILQRPQRWYSIDEYQHNKEAGHCHCLPYSVVVSGLPHAQAQQVMNRFLQGLRQQGRVYLRGHGADITLHNFKTNFPAVDWGMEKLTQVGQAYYVRALEAKEEHTCGAHTIPHI